MSQKRILFTGGGTAGHVIVNLALIPEFQKQGYEVDYIGSYEGIEKKLIESLEGVTYHGISTGKLRRYMSKENFKDPFKVLKGLVQSLNILQKRKPQVIFSKGGFVSVPVVMAARLKNIPTVIHESDYTPGLANKLSFPFAKKILATFPETMNHLPEGKGEYIGAVVREELFEGNRAKGLSLCDFHKQKPVVMVMGGSTGSKKINDAIRNLLDKLLQEVQIVHICGHGHKDPSINKRGYAQFEYVQDELKDLFAATDYIVSRAGSNAIFEFLALKKPMLLIPLSRSASRGDQILNADSFVKQGYAIKLEEEELTDERLLADLQKLISNRETILKEMQNYQSDRTKEKVIDIIQSHERKK
ncbi:UDP-N-acetylglucosamine-N-acetylmuramylpentapeptide N-acetylglucosamine transferase [Halobacillus karajensis]|uniref:UDP-N-acetylglucosamine--N-acetylmuramyl-(pentapeptide) pyrophosphoryl-undecaprenol N-acetylglucosamine transferase n=1 Tax=Halobacillus karajensis TaxID=195088 RepID=A0A024P7Z0_9BACI|nr:undecaprenyldiphospho-muramoylpentapeptide beta-N-acetylglucosaminyltransferase [Halobacillus karajensis]CDQ21185.1 UDP-N-acetylglucosamine--N-acetylmuramyl-(pentapeptide) pyrophosphoryl-undecaprenol N-acetylglucosamine transferase [Halobacillus karajensis]CDQ24751.1 UDP-N-acetylglucosamine--N-acetylmuramyl-(pentapeptide) pyrophosphoryl-undecaprenol N-acetylglucosamine transferase [Halobacillus karajensis]CDQ28889.1 UDP-N-acetylglucosamine--N-acetylmuramyl-(pentapeptide) pyrophosphoryl-undeca